MNATAEKAPRFSPARYARVIGDDTEIGIEGLRAMLVAAGVPVYGDQSIHAWRRTGKAEGGYGPVGLVTPARFEPRGGATPMPKFRRGDVAKWLIQTGRWNMITFEAQQPISPGKGGQHAVDASRAAAAK